MNATNTNNFRNVNTDGSNNNNNANNSLGFAPGFKSEHGAGTKAKAVQCPELKGGLAPRRMASKEVTVLNLLSDTAARTLLAWPGEFGG